MDPASRIPGRSTAILIGLVIASFAITPCAGEPLYYTDISPAGGEFPEWDGGDTGLCFADINSDGNMDFLSIGDHGSPYIGTAQHGVMVYFGDGDGGWSIHMAGNFGYGGIAVGDVNNDGLLDVGYGMHHDYSSSDFGDQLIEVALGDGTGTAWMPWDDGLGESGEDYGMFATDLADMDQDGDLDLVSNSFGSGNGVHVYRNNGDGSWTQTWAVTGGNAQSHVCFGDVNGDGYPDIAASYQYGTIFLGDGLGGFSAADDGLPSSGLGLNCVSLGDVDGDGCADLSFALSGNPAVYLWRSDHWEDSSAGLSTANYMEITRLWDMDVDGLPDLVAMGEGICLVWRGNGIGQWTLAGGFDNRPANETAALAVGGDIDHNGYPDVALVQEEGSWISYRNYLYVFKETSEPAERFVTMHSPRGGESFHSGSAQVVRWSSAHLGSGTAEITIDLSTTGPGGPWTTIAAGIPDSGHFQWIVPEPAGTQAHLRITLEQDSQTVSAISQPFTILSGAGTIAVSLEASPVSGTLPFSTSFQVALTNNYTGYGRRVHLRLNVLTASGLSIPGWREATVNLPADSTFSTGFNQMLPDHPALYGSNSFTLVGADVTPSPFNQPPYPPSGDTDTDSCTVQGTAP